MVAQTAALRGPEIPHGQQKSQIVLLAPHQDGTKQDRRCSHSTPSRGCTQQDLTRQSHLGHSGHTGKPI